MQKSLDQKLAEIHADPHGSKAFILADAKDPDMAFGVPAPGRGSATPGREYRSLDELHELMREITRQAKVDIMLMSASANEKLTVGERLFDTSSVTPAVRANDTTDIHVMRGSQCGGYPSLPFRTATLDHIQAGKIDPTPEERKRGANLGLYSITFNNDCEQDAIALDHFREFRIEAERKGFRYFLEVFDPNVPGAVPPDQLGHYVNDCVCRCLAGVTSAGRPRFLKMAYHGPKAMEELVHYDPHLVPGILGGSAGTTYDAFKLLAEAKKYGGRAALFGRKINNAEHQLSFIEFLHRIANDQISAEEAVKAYHGVLQKLGIAPHRALDEDSKMTDQSMAYSGTTVYSLPSETASAPAPKKDCGCGCGGAGTCSTTSPEASASSGASDSECPMLSNGKPDFAKMTPQQKIAWNKAERDRVFGF